MTTATKRLTLEEYLNYDNGKDRHYELMEGELVEMPPESPKNVQIALFLLTQFLQFVPIHRITNKAEIIVTGFRTTTRIPALMVLTEELAAALQDKTRSTITSDMPPPALVVEVVSPGKVNQDRDYRYKRSEYGARGIAEYWIVDPQTNRVTVLILTEGLYEETVFEGDKAIASVTFPQLQLSANQIFNTSSSSSNSNNLFKLLVTN
jgi:Uma2 family endonuclease